MICLNCGKRLKDAKSIERGYGPICYKKVKGNTTARKYTCKDSSKAADEFPYYDIPGQMNLEDYLHGCG